MKLAMGLRAAAIALGIAGAIDPVWRVDREVPRPIDLQVSAEPGDAARASELARRMAEAVQNDVTFDSSASPVARVVVGRLDVDETGIPTSFVTLDGSSGRGVRIEAVAEPRTAIAGWRTTISAAVRGRGVAGTTSAFVLEQNGVELGRVEHKWSGADERAEVSIPYVPAVEGAARLSLRVKASSSEANAAGDAADVRLVARARPLRVLVHEPRPSWAAAFVRRTLEGNAAFEVSAFAGASKGLAVKAGSAPHRLDSQVDEFDAVVVGAPEDLVASEVDVLARFARRRGGAVLLLPDRRPSGPYLALLRAREFDEVLVEKPMSATGTDGGILRATELALPRSTAGVDEVLAATAHDGMDRPVVSAWSLGAGRVVFSGALDAWRFRAAGEGDFSRFWTSAIAAAALASPGRLDVAIEPGLARPGDKVAVRVRLRGSEIGESTGGLHVPPVKARVISARGAQEMVRLWPSEEPGAFEGWMSAPAAGQYDVQAASGALEADTVLIVRDDANVRRADVADREAAIAAATGGVVVGADDLEPLVQALRAIPAPRVAHDVHPARSPWFVAAFALLLSGEWMLRRRSGLR